MKAMQKNIVVITGGPGFGKSSLVGFLAEQGYLAGEEAAREVIETQRGQGGSLLPAADIKGFQREVLRRRVAFYESVPGDRLAFSDRGIPDQLAYARFRGFVGSAALAEAATLYRYAPVVFVCPPWEAIYRTDAVRTESFAEASRLHQLICETWSRLDYTLVELPFAPVSGRADFILNYLK